MANLNLKEIKNELIKFGLSENQASIYLLLIQHGELRIQEIANLTQIPRSSVYEHLRVLFELGLAEKQVGEKFIGIKPYPLGSMKHGLNEKLQQLQIQLDNLENIEKAIKLLPGNKSAKPTVVRYYEGVSGARQLLWNTLGAKDTVLVYSAWGRGRYVGIKFYKSFVRESRERQMKEKVLVNPTNHFLDSIRKYAGTSIGRTIPQDVRALSQDIILIKGDTFIYNNVFAQVYLHDAEITGFEIESSSFAETQRSIFETLWRISKSAVSLLQNKRD